MNNETGRTEQQTAGRRWRLWLLQMFMAVALSVSFGAQTARAQYYCAPCTGCVFPQRAVTMAYIVAQHEITREFTTLQMMFHQNWLFGAGGFFNNGVPDSFWELHALPALMMMTEQLVTVGMEQMLILGSFFDARQQLKTQRLFQEKAAEAHRDYHPNFNMCTIGTTARSMAPADRNGELTSFILSQRSQDRQMGMHTANAAFNSEIDREGRIRQVIARYCEPRDNSAGLFEMCGAPADGGSIGKDIDFTRTIDSRRTLNLDFTDGAPTADEQDVLALASNLFSHEVLTKPGRTPLNTEAGEGFYMDMRALIAKRSVVENSFNAHVGLKTAGTPISEETMLFTQHVLHQLGVEDEAERMILLNGTIDNDEEPALRPSYFAQLETIAQKIYLDPEFYTNLYDKPANVARKDVAMQAINLMLERDMYKSELRSEMNLSVLLEMELIKYQDDLQNRLNAVIEKYQEN